MEKITEARETERAHILRTYPKVYRGHWQWQFEKNLLANYAKGEAAYYGVAGNDGEITFVTALRHSLFYPSYWAEQYFNQWIRNRQRESFGFHLWTLKPIIMEIDISNYKLELPENGEGACIKGPIKIE